MDRPYEYIGCSCPDGVITKVMGEHSVIKVHFKSYNFSFLLVEIRETEHNICLTFSLLYELKYKLHCTGFNKLCRMETVHCLALFGLLGLTTVSVGLALPYREPGHV